VCVCVCDFHSICSDSQVAKKDELILALQQQARETEGRVEQYEELLQRQRQELLS